MIRSRDLQVSSTRDASLQAVRAGRPSLGHLPQHCWLIMVHVPHTLHHERHLQMRLLEAHGPPNHAGVVHLGRTDSPDAAAGPVADKQRCLRTVPDDSVAHADGCTCGCSDHCAGGCWSSCPHTAASLKALSVTDACMAWQSFVSSVSSAVVQVQEEDAAAGFTFTDADAPKSPATQCLLTPSGCCTVALRGWSDTHRRIVSLVSSYTTIDKHLALLNPGVQGHLTCSTAQRQWSSNICTHADMPVRTLVWCFAVIWYKLHASPYQSSASCSSSSSLPAADDHWRKVIADANLSPSQVLSARFARFIRARRP